MKPFMKRLIRRVTNLPTDIMIRGLLIILLFIGSACKSQEKSNAKDSLESGNSLELTLLVTDNYGGSESADFQVIRDMKTLEKFFAHVNKTRKPGLPVPQVNFDQDILILYCPGQRMRGGTPGLIMKENMPQKIVFMQEVMDPEKKMGIEALTMPFSLYKLPLTEKELVFEKEN